MLISRIGKQRISDWRVGGRALPASQFRRNNRPAISGFRPTARERHGCEQRSTIAPKLIFGYLNCRTSNIVLKYSTEGGDYLLGTKGAINENIHNLIRFWMDRQSKNFF